MVNIYLGGRRVFFYHGQVLHRLLFVPFFTWWCWSVPDDDGLRVIRHLGWCSLGIYYRLLVFPEACEGLSV